MVQRTSLALLPRSLDLFPGLDLVAQKSPTPPSTPPLKEPLQTTEAVFEQMRQVTPAAFQYLTESARCTLAVTPKGPVIFDTRDERGKKVSLQVERKAFLTWILLMEDRSPLNEGYEAEKKMLWVLSSPLLPARFAERTIHVLSAMTALDPGKTVSFPKSLERFVEEIRSIFQDALPVIAERSVIKEHLPLTHYFGTLRDADPQVRRKCRKDLVVAWDRIMRREFQAPKIRRMRPMMVEFCRRLSDFMDNEGIPESLRLMVFETINSLPSNYQDACPLMDQLKLIVWTLLDDRALISARVDAQERLIALYRAFQPHQQYNLAPFEPPSWLQNPAVLPKKASLVVSIEGLTSQLGLAGETDFATAAGWIDLLVHRFSSLRLQPGEARAHAAMARRLAAHRNVLTPQEWTERLRKFPLSDFVVPVGTRTAFEAWLARTSPPLEDGLPSAIRLFEVLAFLEDHQGRWTPLLVDESSATAWTPFPLVSKAQALVGETSVRPLEELLMGHTERKMETQMQAHLQAAAIERTIAAFRQLRKELTERLTALERQEAQAHKLALQNRLPEDAVHALKRFWYEMGRTPRPIPETQRDAFLGAIVAFHPSRDVHASIIRQLGKLNKRGHGEKHEALWRSIAEFDPRSPNAADSLESLLEDAGIPTVIPSSRRTWKDPEDDPHARLRETLQKRDPTDVADFFRESVMAYTPGDPPPFPLARPEGDPAAFDAALEGLKRLFHCDSRDDLSALLGNYLMQDPFPRDLVSLGGFMLQENGRKRALSVVRQAGHWDAQMRRKVRRFGAPGLLGKLLLKEASEQTGQDTFPIEWEFQVLSHLADRGDLLSLQMFPEHNGFRTPDGALVDAAGAALWEAKSFITAKPDDFWSRFRDCIRDATQQMRSQLFSYYKSEDVFRKNARGEVHIAVRARDSWNRDEVRKDLRNILHELRQTEGFRRLSARLVLFDPENRTPVWEHAVGLSE